MFSETFGSPNERNALFLCQEGMYVTHYNIINSQNKNLSILGIIN